MKFLQNLYLQFGSSKQADFSESAFGNATPKKIIK